MAGGDSALASLMAPSPSRDFNFNTVGEAMRARAMMPYQQALLRQQTQEGQARTGLIGQQTEAASIENQMQQRLLGLYSNPRIKQAMTPTTAPSGGASQQPQAQNDDPTAKINELYQIASEESDPLTAQKFIAPYMEHYKGMQEISSKNQDMYTKAHTALGDAVASVLTSENKLSALTDLQAELKKNPIPNLPPNESAEIESIDPNDPHAMEHLNAVGIALRFSSQISEASSKKTAALKGQQETAVPSDPQRTTAKNTISSYAILPQTLSAGLQAQIDQAPTLTAMEKVQDRADKANESFQRSADARSQAETMADVEKRKAVQLLAVKDDQELTQKLQGSQGIRGLLDMSKGGNQQATQAALVRFAEHEVVEGGVKRFNETELKALGSGTGTAWRQLEAWYDKGAKGKLPEMTNAEMGQILDMEDEQARTVHGQNIAALSGRMGVKLENPPAQPKAVTVKNYTQADVDRAVAAGHGSAADIDAAFKAKGWTKK